MADLKQIQGMGDALQSGASKLVGVDENSNLPPTSPTTIPNNTSLGGSQSLTGGIQGTTGGSPTISVGGIPTKQKDENPTMEMFTGFVDKIRSKIEENNKLATSRSAILNAIYNRQPTQEELSKLDPATAALIQGGDRSQMEMTVRMLNDQMSGRVQSLDKSVDYLTKGYETSINQAETQKKDAQTFIATQLKDAVALGLSPKQYMTQLYGEDGLKKLETITGLSFSDTGVSGMDIQTAIASQESGGDYTAVNKDSGALGKYQIMPEYWFASINLDPNSEEDKQKFLSSPELQDKAYSNVINSLQKQYAGDQDKVIAAYYGGDAAAQIVGTPAADKKQGGGKYPSINEYVQQVKDRMGLPTTQNFSLTAQYPSDKDASIPVKEYGGRTKQALYNDAVSYLFQGKNIQSFIGGLASSGNKDTYKTAIQNKAAAISRELNLSPTEAQTLYKSNSSAIKQNTERMARVESITNSVVNQFPRLAILADQIRSEGLDITESDIQSGAAKALQKFGSPTAAAYIELVNTIRADYAANNAALAGSRGGEFFARAAQEAIPTGLTSSQYNAIKDTMVASSQNIKDGIQQTMGELSSGISGKTDDISSQVKDKGYDYESMKKDGLSDDDIKSALGL